MTYSLITPKTKKNFKLDFSARLGRGATADVYKVQIEGKYYAVKIFKKPDTVDWSKLNAITELGYEDDYAFVKTHAWPLGIIQENSKNIGFAMGLFDLGLFLTIDHYYDNLLRPKIKDTDLLTLPNLILIAKNLCIELNKLHSRNIFLVDVKPQNIAINTSTNEVIILDCDGFAFEKDGVKYPAGLVSSDYIAPEVTINKLAPKTLGLGQDLYALSVIIFQILNRGLHPYSGISKGEIEATTNDEKAALGQYAYGVKANENIKPHVSSLHEMWDDRILVALENCFTGGKRKSAKDWLDIFKKIEGAKGYVPCEKFPKDALHIKFKDKECMQCKLDGLKIIDPPEPPPPPPPPTPPPAIKSQPPWFLIAVIAVTAFFALYNFVGNSEDKNICNVAAPEYCNEQILCLRATTASGSKNSWTTSSGLLPYVLEAKKRGYTCNTFQSNSGGSSNTAKVGCAQNPASCTKDQLCNHATYLRDGLYYWREVSGGNVYRMEAKRRGENCNVGVTCRNDPSACKELELCQKSTFSIGNKKYWSSSMSNYVREAKSRGLNCGVESQVIASINNCSLNPKSCSQDILCSHATRLSTDLETIWETSPNWKAHVAEAKRRGLQCGVNKKTTANTAQQNNNSENFVTWTDHRICSTATLAGSWSTRSIYQPHVREAKRRGLTCGVNKKTNSGGSSNTASLRFMSKDTLCTLASKLEKQGSTKRIWETETKYNAHVKEAKRRGLTCGVNKKTNSGGSSNTASLRFMSKDTLCTLASKLEKQGSTKRIWETETKYNAHVKEAKRRGLTCGVNKKTATSTAQKNNNSGNLRNWTDNRICSTATLSGAWEARSIYQPHVKEAKRRGLHCGVNKKTIVSTAQKNNNSGNIVTWTDNRICSTATLAGSWSTRSIYQPHVREAKRRGLTCGVKKKVNSVGSASSASMRGLSDSAVCLKASFIDMQNNDIRKWNNKNAAYVKEAERRGLTCGVKTKVTSVSKSCISNPKSCSDKSLCKTARYAGSWEPRKIYQPHVKEAKRRGLTCDLKNSSNSPKNLSKAKTREFKGRVIKNFDLYPNGFKVYSESKCAEKCLKHKKCKAISFEKRTRICKLKTIQNPMNFDANFTTIHILN